MDLFNKKKLQEQEKQLKKLNLMINDKNSEINRQYNSITHLENNQGKLLAENQKLIEWIEKILDTVGTLEVREKIHFQIPVLMQKEYSPYDKNYLGIFEKERIEIPAITIVKMG